MDILKSYWRMEYVTAPSKDDQGHENPFAKLHQTTDDRSALILHRGTHHYLVLNKYPYNPGHMMVVPYAEVPGLKDLSPEARAEMMEMVVLAQETAEKAMKPDGFNIGFNLGRTAGAGIPRHLHCHIVPRWNGDTNFMPVIGQTRTLPQALDQTWECLKKFC